VSRSCAAALIMYACWLGAGHEGEAMERVLAQRPIAVPNRRMVEIADRLLDRKGCLLEVLGQNGLLGQRLTPVLAEWHEVPAAELDCVPPLDSKRREPMDWRKTDSLVVLRERESHAQGGRGGQKDAAHKGNWFGHAWNRSGAACPRRTSS